MNLFRSEEHARNFEGFNPDMEAALMPVASWADLFSIEFFRQRGRADYISWTRTDEGAASFAELRARLPQSRAAS